eukprot:COSAG01_NODE_46462_length_400_cov_0.508306_1_plen_56_part_10
MVRSRYDIALAAPLPPYKPRGQRKPKMIAAGSQMLPSSSSRITSERPPPSLRAVN